MLDGLKRLFSRPGALPRGWDELVVWAQARQYVFRPVREEGGFIVEGQLGAMPWRLEWGPSQRPYVEGAELRLRAEVGLHPDVQAMVLDRMLQASMEASVFEQYVEGVQTRIDNQTPPEMRWLVMHPKLTAEELGALRERFAAVGASQGWVRQWLAEGLTGALLAAPLDVGQPLVLMVARGRLTLRTALAEPKPAALDAWLALFHAAMRESRRMAALAQEVTHASTQPSLWLGSQSPGQPPDER